MNELPLEHGKVATRRGPSGPSVQKIGYRLSMVKLQLALLNAGKNTANRYRLSMVKLQRVCQAGSDITDAYVTA